MESPPEFFPEIEAYNSGFLDTGEGHLVYFEESGNKEGFPVVQVHGGPGHASDAQDRRFIDPSFRHIMIHQRGCGNSKPAGELWKNETPNLAQDIKSILSSLRIEKAGFFSWSWGSFLTLYYAINYPKTVSAISVGGIFLGTREETGYLFREQPAGSKAWDTFINHVPPDSRHDPVGYFYHQITSPNLFRKRYYAEKWAAYELSVLYPELSSEEISKLVPGFSFESALLETHYFSHNCFVAENYIILNAEKIKHIPMCIIQGQNDRICPPLASYRLHKALPLSTYHPVKGGHSRRDPDNIATIIIETNALFRRVA